MIISRKRRYGIIAFVVSIAMCFGFLPQSPYVQAKENQKSEIAEPEMEEVMPGLKISSDEALMGLLEQGAEDNIPVRGSRGNKLSKNNQAIYDYLKSRIEEIALGKSSDTKITVPTSAIFSSDQNIKAAELGLTGFFKKDKNGNVDTSSGGPALTDEAEAALIKYLDIDTGLVLDALMYDFPFELYWYDKTEGVLRSSTPSFAFSKSDGVIDDSKITIPSAGRMAFYFTVSHDYAVFTGEFTYDPYSVDAQKSGSVQNTIDSAQAIVGTYSDESDYDKLKYYKDVICDRVSYNTYAASDSDTNYGDPWQIIYVFDGDEKTNVVCEGYSKAFKYLCDITDFENEDIECELVTGTMTGGKGAGRHMWNIVHMDDEYNYLVDVTNCDDGTIGAPDKLFLAGTSDGDADRYSFILSKNITYIYDEDTLNLFSDDERVLYTDNYDPNAVEQRKAQKTAESQNENNKEQNNNNNNNQNQDSNQGQNGTSSNNSVTSGSSTGTGNGSGSGTATGSQPGAQSAATGGNTVTSKINITNAVISGIKYRMAYTGKAIGQTLVIKLNGQTLKAGTDYTIRYDKNTNVGSATMTITGQNKYAGSIQIKYNIIKATQPMKAKIVQKTVKFAKAKKKNQIVSRTIKLTNAKGKVTYKKISGDKKLAINAKTGKVTVKKGAKKGLHKMKVRVTAAGTGNYNAGSKKVTVKIKVK